MRKIRKGDEIIVLTGKEKGKRGTVSRILPDKDCVIVDNVNMIKRHTRPNPNRGVTGGIVEKAAPLHVSNVALFNPVTGKADRVGFKLMDDGQKVRVFKSNGEVVDI